MERQDSETSTSAQVSDATDDVLPSPSSTSSFHGDINTAAALRAQYAIEIPKVTRRRRKKNVAEEEADPEPLVDNTATLQLRSKKTDRLQKRQQKKSESAAIRQARRSLLTLPEDLLYEVLCHLRPSDVFRLSRTSSAIRSIVKYHENLIARDIIRRRYWSLYRCFPLPVALKDVPADAVPALLADERQKQLNMHRRYYHHHIPLIDPHELCTCMTCVFAWNNLCVLIDLHHWQGHLERREPIPMIARGTNPPWNQELLQRNATIVREAMCRPLIYASILEKHLSTIAGTIERSARWKKPSQKGPTRTTYNFDQHDRDADTDAFLERQGPPSYDFPFHRDNYYFVEAYMPNRKWGESSRMWHYYALPPAQHERDLEWIKASVKPHANDRIQARMQALGLQS